MRICLCVVGLEASELAIGLQLEHKRLLTIRSCTFQLLIFCSTALVQAVLQKDCQHVEHAKSN